MKHHKVVSALAIGVLGLAMAAWQFGGNVGAQTYEVQAFNAAIGVPVSATFKNIGQSSHWLSYCATGATAVEIDLEASNDGTDWFAISQVGTSTTCGVVSAGGYYQDVRAHILASNGQITAYYSASTFPIEAGGAVAASLDPQVVATASATALLASGVTTGSGAQLLIDVPSVVTDFYVYNPNATPIYAVLSYNGQAKPLLEREVPATSGVDVPIPGGISFPTVTAACSTDYGGTTSPTTGCQVNVTLRVVGTAAVSVSSGGVVLSSPEVAH